MSSSASRNAHRSLLTVRPAPDGIAHYSLFVPRHTGSLVTALLLVALPVLFFWRLYAPRAGDRAWLPGGDLTQQYFPLRVIAAREIASGRLPLWNAHMFAGQPALADSQMAVLYPVNLLTDIVLAWLHQPFTLFVFELQIVLHYVLAALFTFAFAYRHTQSRFAAWVAALTFTFGGYLVSYPAQQPTILESAIWLPLVLLLLEAAAHQPAAPQRLAGLALAGAAMALSILAGHPQTFIYVFYTALAYWVYLAIKLKSGTRKGFLVPLLSVVLFAAFAFGIAAVQFLPVLEFTRLSTRAQAGYPFTSGGFALHELITLLIPGYFGGSPLYVGIIPLLLAGAALAVRRPAVIFWLLLALVALFLSFGDSAFVYPFFYLLAPGFALVRDQERAALLWSFALAMLAAIGAADMRRWTQARTAIQRIFGGLLLVLLILIAFAYIGALLSESAQVEVNLFPGALRQLVPDFFYILGAWALWRAFTHTDLPRRWLAAGLLALIALQLFSVNASFHFQKATPPDYFPETPLTRALSAEVSAHPTVRVSSEGLLPGGHNAGALYGFADIGGNDPLSLQATARFGEQLAEQRKFQLLAVGYVISQRTLSPEAFDELARDGEARLYRFTRSLPRAWLVHEARVGAPEQLNAAEFDPARTALLNGEPLLSLSPGSGADAVEIVQHTTGHLLLHTRSSANALLVISEIHCPRAWVHFAWLPPAIRAHCSKRTCQTCAPT